MVLSPSIYIAEAIDHDAGEARVFGPPVANARHNGGLAQGLPLAKNQIFDNKMTSGDAKCRCT